jgi:hypothetical protein
MRLNRVGGVRTSVRHTSPTADHHGWSRTYGLPAAVFLSECMRSRVASRLLPFSAGRVLTPRRVRACACDTERGTCGMAHLFPSAGRQAYLESYHVDVEPNSAVDLTRPDVRTIDSPFYRNVYACMPVTLCLSFFFLV